MFWFLIFLLFISPLFCPWFAGRRGAKWHFSWILLFFVGFVPMVGSWLFYLLFWFLYRPLNKQRFRLVFHYLVAFPFLVAYGVYYTPLSGGIIRLGVGQPFFEFFWKQLAAGMIIGAFDYVIYLLVVLVGFIFFRLRKLIRVSDRVGSQDSRLTDL